MTLSTTAPKRMSHDEKVANLDALLTAATVAGIVDPWVGLELIVTFACKECEKKDICGGPVIFNKVLNGEISLSGVKAIANLKRQGQGFNGDEEEEPFVPTKTYPV